MGSAVFRKGHLKEGFVLCGALQEAVASLACLCSWSPRTEPEPGTSPLPGVHSLGQSPTCPDKAGQAQGHS